jgi:alanine dehydrogenase
MPSKVYVTLPQGDFRTMPAYIPGLSIAGVKIVNVHPDNPALGLPTVMALTIILDVDTGVPVAILNATHLTDLRTGAAGAVACRYLAPRRSVTLGLVGSGRQAEAQLAHIAEVLAIEELRVWSLVGTDAEHFVEKHRGYDGKAVTLERACDVDVLVTTTPSRTPLIHDAWVHEGTHINAIGADAPGKEELDPSLLLRSSVFVDDIAQAVHSGEVNVPIRDGIFPEERIAGTLGEVVLGKKGRRSPEEITIFDSTGLALQDLAIANLVLELGGGIELPFP